MARIAHFILVNAPPERVFAFLADPMNIPRIQSQFSSVNIVTEKHRGLGAAIDARGRFRGFPITARMDIVGFEEPQLLVSDTTGAINSRTTWRLRPAPESAAPDGSIPTRVTLIIEYTVSIPGLALLGNLVHSDVDSMTIDSLRRLKTIVETEG
jgi:uncharacterized membrane protein